MTRVFIAVRHSLHPHYFYGNLWSSNFYPALKGLNCEIIESQVDLLAASRFMQISHNFTIEEDETRSGITQQIIDEVKKAHQKSKIDLFLSYFYNSHFNPSGFDQIHQLGIPTVNFYCNSIHQFDLVREIAAKVNYSWHTERNARDKYLQAGANPIWIQMAGNPTLYYPVSFIQRKSATCFVGQRYADRDRHIAYLLKQQIPVDVYGSGWGNPNDFSDSNHSKNNHSHTASTYLGRSISQPGSFASYRNLIQGNLSRLGILRGTYRTLQQLQHRVASRKLRPLVSQAARGYADNIPETFASYEVILNFSNVWSDSYPGSPLVPHVRLRDFEAPLCRTCYLTGYSDEIGEFYELGQEIDTYQSPEELTDKVHFYLSHPQEADHLRAAGYQRAIRDHTWVNRFQELFTKIGLKS